MQIYGESIQPRHPKSGTSPLAMTEDELGGLVKFAKSRCQSRMMELTNGVPLTDVLIRSYIQGLVDAAATMPTPKDTPLRS
jgi:hypothetical protein